MVRSWRTWVLLFLVLGPVLAYMGLGALWLYERHWGLYAFAIWVGLGMLFGILSVRWTKDREAILPPIDWDIPRTFRHFDEQAWKLVEEEAENGEALAMENLTSVDIYIDTGKRMAARLAAHYHPLSTNPVENLPIVQILTALDLAAEDLVEICREIPGGDMVTFAHWKKAVQAAGYISKANEIYSFLLPIFQPATGLVRLGTQKLMTQPAWKNMQQNVLRWFYRAYVNRLGIHLIELYSGRLAIGATQYRRLTRKARKNSPLKTLETPALEIAIVGAREAGKTALVEALDLARAGNLEVIRGRLVADGFDENLADLLKTATWAEVPSYTAHVGGETARDRATRRDALAHAVEGDLVLLLIDGRRDDLAPETRFVQEWDQYFEKNPTLESPPMLAVINAPDPESPTDGFASASEREDAHRARAEAVRAALSQTVSGVVRVDLFSQTPSGLSERLLPALAPLLDRAEKVAVIRLMHHASTRSKARRLAGQMGRQGRRIWDTLRTSRTKNPADAP